MRRLFFWTFIFLCTAFSVNAQAPADSLRMKAVEMERIYFRCGDPVEGEKALLQKAVILIQLGEKAEAASTLSRINTFALDSQEQELARKLLEEAASSDKESQKHLVHNALAFLPPLGHIEAGQAGRGVLHALLDAGALSFGIWQVASGQWITGYLCGAVGLEIFWYDEALRLINER